jgi:hypothetical protein
MVANNHNLFPLPCWAPALWRVPTPLQRVNEAYARGVPAHIRTEQRLGAKKVISFGTFVERQALRRLA